MTRDMRSPVAARVTVSRGHVCAPDLHGPAGQRGLRLVPRGRLPSERCLDGMAILPCHEPFTTVNVRVLAVPRCEMHCRSRLFDLTWAAALQ